jgi:hypothetical protein
MVLILPMDLTQPIYRVFIVCNVYFMLLCMYRFTSHILVIVATIGPSFYQITHTDKNSVMVIHLRRSSIDFSVGTIYGLLKSENMKIYMSTMLPFPELVCSGYPILLTANMHLLFLQ